MEISGRLYEIGSLDGMEVPGLRLELNDGSTLQVTGLTEEQCRELSPKYGMTINVTIT